MKHKWDDILTAFEHVSSGMQFEVEAVLNRETGEVFYASDNAGFDDDEEGFPEDVEENPDKYISIPHK